MGTWLATGVVIGFALCSSAAGARPPGVQSGDRHEQLRAVLDGLDLALAGDQLTFGPRGRRDLVLFSPRALDKIVTTLKDAYRASRTLAHGYRIAGWAHLVATGGWTFTLKDANEASWVIELADAGLGTRVVFWGLGREWLPERRPLVMLPLRLVAP